MGDSRTRMLLGMTLLLVLAAGLRFWGLGREGVWCDEAYTARTVALPWDAMFTRLVSEDDAPPLYYLLQKPLAAFDHREAILRLPSALAGLAAVALLLYRSRRDRDRAALWAAALLAVHAYAVFYARQARSYSLLILLALILIYAARDLLDGRRRAGPVLAGSGLLLWMTHHIGVLLVVTSLLTYPLRRRGSLTLPRWALWHAIPLALWAGYWLASSGQFGQHAELNAWIAAYWERHSLLLAPLASLEAMLPGALQAPDGNLPLPVLVTRQSLWIHLSFAAALLMLYGLLAPARWRGRSGSLATPPGERRKLTTSPGEPRNHARTTAIEFAFFLGPLVLLAVASMISAPAYVVGRTDSVAFAAFVLLAGRGLARLPLPAAAAVWLLYSSLSFAILAPSYGLIPNRTGPQGTRAGKGSDRATAAFLAGQPGFGQEPLVHGILTAPSIEYYLERSAPGHPHLWFPQVAGANPAAVAPTPLDSLDVYRQEALALRARWEETLEPDQGPWILATLQPPGREAPVLTADGTITANSVAFPTSLLVYTLVGIERVTPARVYQQDWMGGMRAVLHLPRSAWIDLEALPAIQSGQASPAAGGGR